MSTILIISPEHWEAHFVSKHLYACELARRGHQVLFYGPPEAVGPMRLTPATDVPGDLRVLRAPRVAPGLRFMPSFLRRELEARWLGQVEQLAGATIDVVWNFENSRFFDMGFAGKRLKIYQQVDLNQNFHPDLAAETSDLSIAISGPIEQRIAPVARRLIRITHGHAAPPDIETGPKAGLDELMGDFSRARINVVLVGNLDLAYLDVPLLEQLVRSHPETRFHFVGSYTPARGLHSATGAAPNVRFWGRQPAQALPAFFARADLLLVAYMADSHLEQLANPHKVMEYLASGRCILASRTLDYEGRGDLIEMATDRSEYACRFGAIVADPASWNRPEQIARRQDFASDHTYARQIDRIAVALGHKGHLLT